MITKPVAEEINLEVDSPLVEIIEVKKNKSFIAKKTKIFKEEEKIHSNAPVETVTINNICSAVGLINYAFTATFSLTFSRNSFAGLNAGML